VKIGVSAFAWTSSFGASHLQLLQKIMEYGFTGFEIPMFLPADLPVTSLRKTFESTGLDCTVCAILPAGINPISKDAAIRKRSFAHLVECVETSAELGAHLLGGPLFAPIGYIPGHRRTEDEWKWAVEMFQSLGDLLDKSALIISIEPVNRYETFFLRTLEEAKEFCNAITHPRIGITVDTFHANIEEKCIATAIEGLGSHLRHIHASENDRGLLGSGHVNFPAILEVLHKYEYDGYLMIEGFGFSPDEPNAPGALWADRNVSPEDIALRGLAYLNSLNTKFN
jgi:D-psicose/D-tagatose/L-ribulose 3-epimerase